MANLIPDNLNVDSNELHFEKQIGSGPCAQVWKGTWQGTGAGKTVAIKKIELIGVTVESQTAIMNEVIILSQLRNPLLLQIFGACIVETELWIITEFIDGGSLFELLHSKTELSWELRLQLAYQAVISVHVLHSYKILHRDIKSLNFLVSKDWKNLKLIDFGFSKYITAKSIISRSAIGTIRWNAPETFCNYPQWSIKSDIYSLGITFYEIVSREIPFKDVPEMVIIQKTIEQKCPTLPNYLQLFESIIKSCCNHDPNKRPTSQQIINNLDILINSFKKNKNLLDTSSNELVLNNRKKFLYITIGSDLLRYDSKKKKFIKIASNYHFLHGHYHHSLCFYAIDNFHDKLQVYFVPWEQSITIANLHDFININYYLIIKSLLFGDKFYILFAENFVCIDLTTLICEYLPFPAPFNEKIEKDDLCKEIFVGTEKYIHLIYFDELQDYHKIFDIENKIWISAKYPQQLIQKDYDDITAVSAHGDIYIFGLQIAICYIFKCNEWINLPIPPIQTIYWSRSTHDSTTFEIWFFDGYNMYTYNIISQTWTNHLEMSLINLNEKEITNFFISCTFENNNIQIMEDKLSFFISKISKIWKHLYKKNIINTVEKSLMMQFEQCSLTDKVILLKNSEYLSIFVKFFTNEFGLAKKRICEFIWQICREEPSLTLLLYQQVTMLHWIQVFTIPIEYSFTFITKKQCIKIIQTQIIPTLLQQWLPKRTFLLLYKASKDKVKKNEFHQMCNYKGATICIINDDNGYFFGGYTPIEWGINTKEIQNTKRDNINPNFFLFTITNPYNIPPTQYFLKDPNNQQAYIWDDDNYICFGDFTITWKNYSLNGISCFGNFYNDTTGKGNKTFTQSDIFEISQIKVYQVI